MRSSPPQGLMTFRKEKTGLKGFEPLTCGLRVRRYAELSYRPTLLGLIMWSMMPNKGYGKNPHFFPSGQLESLNTVE
jgi:hypothetical protein